MDAARLAVVASSSFLISILGLLAVVVLREKHNQRRPRRKDMIPHTGRGRTTCPYVGGWTALRTDNRQFVAHLLSRNDDGPYLTHLHVSRATFWKLVEDIRGDPVFSGLENHPPSEEEILLEGSVSFPAGRQSPVSEQLLCALHYYANGGSYASNCNCLGIGSGTFRRHVLRVTAALLNLKPLVVKFPTTAEELTAASNDFYARHGVPGCVGILDGTRISIRNRSVGGAQFQNAKYGTNIAGLICCDGKGCIIYSAFGFPGRMHDSPCLQHSSIYRHRLALTENKKFLMADAGYSLSPWLMTPFKDADAENDTEKRTFNAFFCSRRALIERVIGHLKNRFSILSKLSFCNDLKSFVDICNVCTVLHNYCLQSGDSGNSLFTGEELSDPNISQMLSTDFERTGEDIEYARRIRQSLIKLFNTAYYRQLRKQLRGAEVSIV